MGLQGMRERLAEAGGVLEILSPPQRGFHLRASVPIDAADADAAEAA
jgi:signal transduction histidine kinase